MKLLIITQKVNKNDPILGFFHGWIIEFSKHVESLTVICLEKGECDFPENVKVFSLGKESGKSKIKYIFNYYKFIFKNLKNFDYVFAHMSPWYVILGAPIFKIFNKKISLWYVHRKVDAKLRLAHFFADVVFTATKESFRIVSDKIKYLGQSVDLDQFKDLEKKEEIIDNQKDFELVTVGRITKIKNLDTFIHALEIILEEKPDWNLKVNIIGDAVTEEDIKYKEGLLDLVKNKNLSESIIFHGPIPNKELPAIFARNDLSVNLCPTGGMDKVVLESMAANCPVVLSNEAFRDYFGVFANDLIFSESSPRECADKIINLLSNSEKRKEIAEYLGEEVKKRSDLNNLIKNIVYHLSSV